MGKKFKDLKIGRKLLISYGAIIFLYIITVTASLLGIAKTSNTLDVFYQKAFAVSYTALDMKASVQGIGRCILDVATGVTDREKVEKIAEAREMENTLVEGFAFLEKNLESDELLNSLKEQMAKVEPARNTAIELCELSRYEEALELYNSWYEPNTKVERETLQKIADKSLERAESYLNNGYMVKRRMYASVIALAAVVLFITIFLWIKITRGIRAVSYTHLTLPTICSV